MHGDRRMAGPKVRPESGSRAWVAPFTPLDKSDGDYITTNISSTQKEHSQELARCDVTSRRDDDESAFEIAYSH